MQVENELNDDIEFELHAKQCASASPDRHHVRSYDTYGSSPWEIVPDILRMYGMCSYHSWFEYLEFIDPVDKVRHANAGVCTPQDMAKGRCASPASFNAFESLWWDTQRAYSQPSMLTLYETRKFQVLPHPCDRDYQHAEGMVGCAPVMEPNQRTSLGLVNMDKLVRHTMPMGKEYATHAQTLLRNGYMNMLGRPPFDYSDGTAMRKSGFLSSDTLLGSNGDTIFVPCKSVKQCFEDKFTHHAKEVTRRVFIEAASQGPGRNALMRDWRANDATRCGIFGVWISDENAENPTGINIMCPGTNPQTHWCCAIDVAVSPLFYLLHAFGPSVLPDLDATCNKPPLNGMFSSSSQSSYQIFSRSKVESLVKQIGRHYAVPRSSAAQTFIQEKARLLNELLNEFSPPTTEIPTSNDYIQIMDCSVALYSKLQQKAICQDPSKPDSGPFCASYHLGFETDENRQLVRTSTESQARSSLYFFLPNTMLEFPFAWWHKCVLLQGRQLASSSPQEALHCREWKENTISAEDMETMEGIYDEEDVRGVLLRVQGGVTSDVVRTAITQLDEALQFALSNFTVSGSRDRAELTSRDTLIAGSAMLEQVLPRSMLRIGAPHNYNMKCYSMAFLPPTAKDFVERGDAYGTDCATNMLMWIHNENANASRYDPPPGKSYPDKGRPGIQPECFVFREQDLTYLSGASYMLNVFQYLSDRFTGNASVFSKSSDSMVHKGLQLADFFSSEYNDAVQGLLIAEFVPPELTGLPTRTPSFSSATGSMRTDSDEFKDYTGPAPCVTTGDIGDRFPECQKTVGDPVPLTTAHCDSLYTQALADIIDYSQRIVSVPTYEISKRWPDPPLYCVWACGINWEGYKQPVHTGLDEETTKALKERLASWNTSCYQDAALKDGNTCVKSDAAAIRKAMLLAKRREYVQEVCGPYVDEAVKYIRDREGLETILNALSLGTASDILDSVQSKSKAGGKGGLSKRAESYLSDDTAKHVTRYPYACKRLTVETTGSVLVDSVREKLSYNDIKVSQNFDKMKEERSKCKAGQKCAYNEFTDKLYQLITSSALDTVSHNCSIYTDKCINAYQRLSETQKKSKKLDASFIWKAKDSTKECLALAVVTGNLDCKYWLSDGLYADIAAVKPLSNKAVRSAVRNKAAGWTVVESKMPDDRVAYTTEFSEVCIMCLFLFVVC